MGSGRASTLPTINRLVGGAALIAGAVSAVVVAIDGTGRFGGALTGDQPTIYGPGQALLVVGLVVAGLCLLVARTRGAVAALVGVVGLCAAQLSGTGLVGFRRWPLFWGCCTPETVTEQTLVRTLALAMAIVCAMTAVACAVVLVRARHVRWAGVDATVVVALGAAIVVGLAGPRLVVGGWTDVKGLAAWALMYSLPFATALALSGLMPRSPALAAAGAVVGSALIATVGESHFESNQPWGQALPLVLAAALTVAAMQCVPWGRRSAVGVTRPPR